MAGAQAAVCHQTQDLELLKLTKIKLKCQFLSRNSHISSSTATCYVEHFHHCRTLYWTELI